MKKIKSQYRAKRDARGRNRSATSPFHPSHVTSVSHRLALAAAGESARRTCGLGTCNEAEGSRYRKLLRAAWAPKRRTKVDSLSPPLPICAAIARGLDFVLGPPSRVPLDFDRISQRR